MNAMMRICPPHSGHSNGNLALNVGLDRDLLRRCYQCRHNIAQRQTRCQHTKVTVPVRAWRWYQGTNANDQFQWRQSELIDLGTTLVRWIK
jgi:hypothetical protein